MDGIGNLKDERHAIQASRDALFLAMDRLIEHKFSPAYEYMEKALKELNEWEGAL